MPRLLHQQHRPAAFDLARDLAVQVRGHAGNAAGKNLAAFGYGVELTSTYGTGLEKVVEAFQRHFRQERLDGYADTSTRDTLSRLIAALQASPVA